MTQIFNTQRDVPTRCERLGSSFAVSPFDRLRVTLGEKVVA
jgi:hypothetical protein